MRNDSAKKDFGDDDRWLIMITNTSGLVNRFVERLAIQRRPWLTRKRKQKQNKNLFKKKNLREVRWMREDDVLLQQVLLMLHLLLLLLLPADAATTTRLTVQLSGTGTNSTSLLLILL